MTFFPTICSLLLFVFVSEVEGKHKPMKVDEMLKSVCNDRIQFATKRPPGSTFTLLDRRVIVLSPAELVDLAASGDVRVLYELVRLLQDPARAWAAEVLLAAMTRREEKLVDTYAASPEKWWKEMGQTAYQRWSAWLNTAAPKLVWDGKEKAFLEKE
jgi:hypothetical protein